MAIERLFQTGAESGAVEFPFNGPGGALALHTDKKMTGTYSYRSSGQETNGFIIPPATRQARAGYFMYGGLDRTITSFAMKTSSDGYMVHLRCYTNGAMDLYVNSIVRDSCSGYHRYAWHHVGIDVKIDASTGWVKVYDDGVEIMSYEGDTRVTGDYDIEKIAIGRCGGIGGVNYGSYPYYDDIYFDDTTGEATFTSPPVIRFEPLFPNGVGNYSEWTPTSGSNFENVDEAPPSSADLVYITEAAKKDSYAMDTYTLESNEVCNAVIPFVYCKRDNVTEELAIGTRLSGVDEVGPDQVLSIGTWKSMWERFPTKPGGGSWGQVDLDAVELLMESAGTY